MLHDREMVEALQRGAHPAILWEVDHPQAYVYAWSGVGKLRYGGNDYQGVGFFGKVSQPEESADLSIKQGTLELRGIPPERQHYLNLALRNRRADVRLAAVENQRVIGTPFLFLSGLMDYAVLQSGEDGSATIQIFVRIGFHSIERAQEKVWSHEQQQEAFPGDTGMSLISSLVDKEIKWRLT